MENSQSGRRLAGWPLPRARSTGALVLSAPGGRSLKRDPYNDFGRIRIARINASRFLPKPLPSRLRCCKPLRRRNAPRAPVSPNMRRVTRRPGRAAGSAGGEAVCARPHSHHCPRRHSSQTLRIGPRQHQYDLAPHRTPRPPSGQFEVVTASSGHSPASSPAVPRRPSSQQPSNTAPEAYSITPNPCWRPRRKLPL